jgi:phage baseplate assembly protein W
MTGMGAESGRRLARRAHIAQSVRTILTTRRGSRVMRREFGSDVRRLIDRNVDQTTLVRLYAATVEALRQWEPRIVVTRVTLAGGATALQDDRVELQIEAVEIEGGGAMRLGVVA